MRQLSSAWKTLGCSLVLSAAAACGGNGNDGGTEPSPVPAYVVVASGNNQVGNVGDPLTDSLVVRVEDAQHHAISGASVSWSATQGGATAAAGSTRTNSAGLAKLGFIPSAMGDVTIGATVASLVPATFAAKVYGHPAGVLGPHAPIGGQPFALAISRAGLIAAPQVAYDQVTFLDTLGVAQGSAVAVGNEPVFASFSPDGSRLYVANRSPSNVAAVIDVATRNLTTSYPAAGSPFGLILGPDGTRLYVAGDDSLRIYTAANGTRLGAVYLGDNSEGLAYSADSTKLYVSTRSLGTVLEISLANNAVLRTFSLGGRIQGVAVKGNTLYAADQNSTYVRVIDLTTGTVSPTSINVNGVPYGLAISPDGKQLWATLLFDGKVAVVNLGSTTASKFVNVGGSPRGIAFGRWGSFAAVANESGYVDVIR